MRAASYRRSPKQRKATIDMLRYSAAKETLKRLLQGADSDSAGPATADLGDVTPSSGSVDINERVHSFVESIGVGSQDWPGRVRLINFDSVRDRVGSAWPKLCDKLEILAEKIIQEELSLLDSHLKIGEAEFLVFFSGASPQEARIRCLAIVEVIHEKLFGATSTEHSGQFAECHTLYDEDLPPDWWPHSKDSAGRAPLDALRSLFRIDAEVLDGGRAAVAAQAALDGILSRAAESAGAAELELFAERARQLTRNLTVLKRAIGRQLVEGESTSAAGTLGDAEKDLVELVKAISITPGYSHSDAIAALANLRRDRAERASKIPAYPEAAVLPSAATQTEPAQFQFHSVYRSAAQGTHIYQGICRIGRATGKPDSDGKGYIGDPEYAERAAEERALLEEAIYRLSGHFPGVEFLLMAPVNLETLRRPHFQRRYSTILRAARHQIKRRLIIEVVSHGDLDDTIGIRRVIEEFRVHVHAVFVTLSYRVGDRNGLAARCKRLGVHAIGLDLSDFTGSASSLEGSLTQFTRAAAELSVATYLTGISKAPIIAKALAAGVTYFSAPRLLSPRSAPQTFERLTLQEFFWRVS